MKLLLSILFILALIMMGVFLFWYFKIKKRQDATPSDEANNHSFLDFKLIINKIFTDNLTKMKEYAVEERDMYSIPFFLLLGPSGSGKSSLMKHLDVEFPFGMPDAKSIDEDPCVFWFTSRGVILEIKGSYIEGKTAEKFYAALLSVLKRHRRRRILDGVIFATSVSMLNNVFEHAIDDSNDQGVLVHLKVFFQAINLRFPLYTLITKSDTLRGFSDLTQVLPQDCLEGMLGWSNPYPLDERFNPHWIEKGIEFVSNAVFKLRFQLFAKSLLNENHEASIFLDREILNLSNAMKYTLEPLNVSDILDKKILFRGFYFVTQDSFTHDVFIKKIFPEHTLAIPHASHNLYDKHKKMYEQGIVVLVSAILITFLWVGGRTLQHKAKLFLPVLNQELAYLKFLSSLSSEDIDKAQLTLKSGHDLMAAFSSIPFSSMRHFLIMNSWFTPFNQRLERMILVGSNSFIYAIYLNLRANEFELLNTSYQPDKNTVDFEQSINYLKKVNQLYQNSVYYNYMVMDKNNVMQHKEDIIKVTQYTLGEKAAELIEQNFAYIVHALEVQKILPFDMRSHKNQWNLILNQLLEKDQEHVTGGLLPIVLEPKITQYLDLIDAGQANYQTLEGLADTLEQLSDYLVDKTDRKLKRTYTPPDNPWPVLTELLTQAGLTPLFDQDKISHDLSNLSKTGNQAIEHILNQKHSLVGYFFGYYEQKKNIVINPILLEVDKSIKFILSSRLPGDKDKAQQSLPVSGNILWSPGQLSRVLQYLDNFNNIKAVLDKQENPLVKIVNQRMEESVFNRELNKQVLNAYELDYTIIPDATSDMAGSMKIATNMKDNFGDLSRIVSNIDALELSMPSSSLASIINKQSSFIILNVSHVLKRDRLYQSGNIKLWNGKQLLSKLLFGTSNTDALKFYLDSQRNRVSFLAKSLIEPTLKERALIKSIDLTSSKNKMVVIGKWKNILEQLTQYDSNNPSIPLVSLETFILQTLNAINDTNCKDIKQDLTWSGDYFGNILSQLKTNIHRQCLTMMNERFKNDYSRISKDFSENLAGFFPFVSQSHMNKSPDIDFEKAKLFYERHINTINRYVESDIDEKQKSDKQHMVSYRFLKDLKQSLEFLIQTTKTGYTNRLINVKPYFRVNRPYETNANQIINWTLNVNGNSTSLQDINTPEKDPLVWTYGMPGTSLQLQWASNAPYKPVANGDPHLTVNGYNVSYGYDGPLGLLRIIEQHKSFDISETKVPYQFVLNFKAKIQKLPDQLAVPIKHYPHVSVFVGFELQDAETKEAILLPHFPVQAPQMRLSSIIDRVYHTSVALFSSPKVKHENERLTG